jgi:hypothetical protein
VPQIRLKRPPKNPEYATHQTQYTVFFSQNKVFNVFTPKIALDSLILDSNKVIQQAKLNGPQERGGKDGLYVHSGKETDSF